MKVLIAASEATPFAKTGGLADVVGSLAAELRGQGVDARVILPLYRGIKGKFKPKYTGRAVAVELGARRLVSKVYSHGDHAYFVECNEFFDRKEIYGTALGEYEDNAFRFIFFSKAALEAAKALGFMPDVVHANDWQTALIPLYLKTVQKRHFKATASLFTIHNLGYQGIFPPSAMSLTGLPTEMFNPGELEFYGSVNLLKAGIISADAVTTVSPAYAVEIQGEEHGFGLNGVLRSRDNKILGILNGIDYKEWNPGDDPWIPERFGAGDLSGKAVCKERLARKCLFKDSGAPLAGMVGRLVAQKGVDIFLEAAEDILACGVNVVVLGKGEDSLQRRLRELARKRAGKFHLALDYDEGLAHMIYAGADMLLIPSQYEPCGITQMIAMRYGAVPVARATGGIRDTVADYDHLRGKGTGFVFSAYSSSALVECVKRALCVYLQEGRWDSIRKACMGKDFSWKRSAARYKALYAKLARRSGDDPEA